MDDRFDALTRQLGEAEPRRRVMQGIGALALGSLGLSGIGQEAEARNQCNRCKHKCKKKNRRKNKKKNCHNKCRNKCRNN